MNKPTLAALSTLFVIEGFAFAQAPLFSYPLDPPPPPPLHLSTQVVRSTTLAQNDDAASPAKSGSSTPAASPEADAQASTSESSGSTDSTAPPAQSGDVAQKMQQLEDRLQTAEGKVEGLAESQTESRGILDQLTKIKFSGYIQGRFEYRGDSASGLNARNQPTQTTQFLVRRGRLKTVYATELTEFLLQIDAASSGVTLKDAEATFIEPWTGDKIRLTVGQFKWPFGYEVLQSSSVREMPERSLVIRRLFPGERDRGVRLQWTHDVLRFQVALVNGNGTQDSLFPANDQNGWKDVVGRLGADFGDYVFGVSGYWGKGVRAAAGNPNAMPPTQPTYAEFDKTRLGADIQTYLGVPHVGGLALKGEFIYGEELGANVLGWYVVLVQNIGDQMGVFTRIDHYDPDINKADNATLAVAGGAQCFLSGNAKLSLVYEHPMTELKDPADDIFTAQLQAMF